MFIFALSPLLWTCASTSTPDAETPRCQDHGPLNIATWNIQHLGQKARSLETVAGVMDDYDLIAVQEVMTPEGAEALLEHLPGFGVLFTDQARPLEGRYREYYAFYYRRSRLTPVFNSYVPDPSDLFRRDPFVGCFDLRDDKQDICLVNIHIVWGDEGVGPRKAEIRALGDALRWAQGARDDAYWVVLGDYNRPFARASGSPFDEWGPLLDQATLDPPLVFAGEEVDTTIGKKGYANSYDHVFLSQDMAAKLEASGRFDTVARVCEGSFERCSKHVSDHAPFWVRVGVEGSCDAALAE